MPNGSNKNTNTARFSITPERILAALHDAAIRQLAATSIPDTETPEKQRKRKPRKAEAASTSAATTDTVAQADTSTPADAETSAAMRKAQYAAEDDAPADTEQANTSAPAYTNEPAYKASVERGKAIVASISGKQWELGDEADAVTQKWGEKSLEQFADDINYHGAPCTLGRCRDVCRAWPKNRARARFFSSAKILATHPHRWEIVERKPDISKADTRKIMSELRAAQKGTATAQTEDDDLLDEAETEPTAETTSTPAKAARAKGPKKTDSEEQAMLKENRRWFNNVVYLANTAIGEAGIMENCTPAQRRQLALAIEPNLVPTVEQGGEVLLALVDWLRKLLAEASDELIEEEGRRIKTSPKRASAPSQAAT